MISLSSSGLATIAVMVLAVLIAAPQTFAQDQQSTQGQQQQKPRKGGFLGGLGNVIP